MNDKVRELLRCARAKIAEPEHWTTGQYARMADGRACTPESPEAAQWCMLGALFACDHERPGSPFTTFKAAEKALRIAADATGLPLSLPRVNDHESHAVVLGLFDKAIAFLGG